MSYTTIDNPELYFQTKLYTGDGSTSNAITFDGSENMQPDWVWIKRRNNANPHFLNDSVRGATKDLRSDGTDAETTNNQYGILKSFDSNGFTVSVGSTNGARANTSGGTFASWNWLAGGTAPAITYTVKVVSDSGNKYRFDDFGTSAVTLDLQEGGTYTFDQSDSSNSGHPLRFSTTSNGTHGGGSEYTTGVTTNGTPGSSGAYTRITVAASAPTLYYYCTQHSAMGGQANTNSTFGSSNFSGSIQSTVSAGITQGMSIVSYTGNGSAGATIGHGLGSAPSMVIVKRRNTTEGWQVFHTSLGNTKYIELNSTSASVTASTLWNNTSPSSSVVTFGTSTRVNASGSTYIAYCFSEVKSFSKFGSYVGNGSSDGSYIHLGFKPAFILAKDADSSDNWIIHDTTRNPSNPVGAYLRPNLSSAEGTFSHYDILSNGFKNLYAGGSLNGSGKNIIYMAFAESPFVNSNGVPTNAR